MNGGLSTIRNLHFRFQPKYCRKWYIGYRMVGIISGVGASTHACTSWFFLSRERVVGCQHRAVVLNSPSQRKAHFSSKIRVRIKGRSSAHLSSVDHRQRVHYVTATVNWKSYQWKSVFQYGQNYFENIVFIGDKSFATTNLFLLLQTNFRDFITPELYESARRPC